MEFFLLLFPCWSGVFQRDDLVWLCPVCSGISRIVDSQLTVNNSQNFVNSFIQKRTFSKYYYVLISLTSFRIKKYAGLHTEFHIETYCIFCPIYAEWKRYEEKIKPANRESFLGNRLAFSIKMSAFSIIIAPLATTTTFGEPSFTTNKHILTFFFSLPIPPLHTQTQTLTGPFITQWILIDN